MTTVVLVHGAWHGAWSFDRVVPLVRDAGVDVVAIDLPGHGANAGPFTDLHGDAAHVVRALDEVDDGIVLLGHSYGVRWSPRQARTTASAISSTSVRSR